jgi:hypothetical protein
MIRTATDEVRRGVLSKRVRRLRWCRYCVVAVAATLATTGAFAAELTPVRVFSRKPANEAGAVTNYREPPLRARVTGFDLSALANIAEGATSAVTRQFLKLELFDDVLLDVEVEKVKAFGPGRFVIQGVIARPGEPDGIALFSVVNGALQAEVATSDGRRFAIDDLGGGACRISEVDLSGAAISCLTESEPSAVQSRGTLTSEAVDGPVARHQPAVAAAGEDDPVVDVMIVYTPAALALFSNAAAVEANCQLVVELANTMFANSLIRARVRLVHTELVNYMESGDTSTDLARLADPADGYLDEVARLREQYQADVVHLFQNDGTGMGIANGFPSDACAVVNIKLNTTFVHELGHNFGCQHDRAAPVSSNGLSYAYGHIFTGKSGKKFGCVMSYPYQSGARPIPYFSNPDVTYDGVPTGIPKGRVDAADNARRVNLTAPVLAAQRAGDGSSSRVPVSASPPRLDFPVTAAGSSTSQKNIRLSFSGASPLRPIRIADFQVTGDAASFQVQVFDNNTQQFLTGNAFTISPPNGIQLFVRFQPNSPSLAEATITFKAEDPGFRYDLPPIHLSGNATAPRLKNISTRGHVGTGENVLVGGLIIGGMSSRDVVIRAVGASLTRFGVLQPLRDPVLEVYQGSTLIAQNDDWGDGFGYEPVRASGLSPADDLESAVRLKLQPGNYTAIVRGNNDSVGTAVVEAYDLQANPATQLLNVSTRGRIGADPEVMIGGCILGGTSPTRVLVRAIGPSLINFGISDALVDPTLDLYDSQGNRIASNDNWRSDNESEIRATGNPPHDDREAALAATLPPAAYTAIVRGANQTTGVALIEVYNVEGE